MKTIISCKTLLYGGSAFSCGASLRAPRETLIVEPGILLAPEFAATLAPVELSEPHSDAGTELLRRLKQQKLAADGKIHAPPLSDFFAVQLLRKKCRALLNCQLTELVRENGVWNATICGIDGFSRISAERIIDTTPSGWRDIGTGLIQSKYLCATLYGPPAQMPQDRLRCSSLIAGPLPGEQILRVDLPANATWHDARLRLHDLWNILRSSNPGLSPGGEASAMGFRYRRKPIRQNVNNGLFWIPGAQYDNLTTAFEEGWQCSWE